MNLLMYNANSNVRNVILSYASKSVDISFEAMNVV